MAERLVRMPLLGAGQAVTRVYMQRTAAMVSHGNDLRMPFLKTSIGLAATGLVPMGILFFYGTELLSLILGERWDAAGSYIEILAPWYYTIWVGTISQATLTVLRRQRLWLWLQISVLAIRAIVFLAAYLLSASPIQTLTAFSAANIMVTAAILALSASLVWKHKP
jgi:O-antigen/teichoic acid export membrane protein